MNLYRASYQWATRPADQRFWTLQDMLEKAQAIKTRGRERTQPLNRLQLRAIGENDRGLQIIGAEGGQASLTHFSFGQLVRTACLEGEKCASVEHLRRLPASMAAQVVNYDLARNSDAAKVLWHLGENSEVQARAFTTEKYGRIWNAEAIAKLLPLLAEGWRVPPARPHSNAAETRIATEADCLQNRMPGLGINPGDKISPAGLYMGEKDMFAFMVNENRPINGGGGSPLYRGFFLENSEVGSLSYWITTFLYNSVCSNHIVWSASNVKEIRVVHVGNNAGGRAAEALEVQLKEYADESASDIEAKIKTARTIVFGTDKAEVVETLYSKHVATQAVLEAAYDAAVEHPEDSGNCDPKSAWGMAQGMTRMSQLSAYMDKRVELDKAAGRILDLATGKSKGKVLAAV